MIDKNEVPPEIDYTEYWETRDGDLIRYADMTDNHLINAHNMIERQVCDFINRCANRNEEQELPEYVQQMIDGLETEMKKRNLINKGDNNKHARIYPLLQIKALALNGLSDSLELEPKTALKEILRIIKKNIT